MLTNLFNTLLISLGTGASLINAPIFTLENRPNLTPTIQRENETTNYDLELARTNPLTATRTEDTYNYQNKKIQIGASNVAMNVVGNIYEQKCYYSYNGNNAYNTTTWNNAASPNIVSQQRLQTIMITIALTPYNYNINTTTTISFTFTGSQAGDPTQTKGWAYQLINTTENISSAIIDNSFYQTTDYINYYNLLLSPVNGYIYGLKNGYADGATATISETITIEPNKTNYYIFYCQAYFRQPNLADQSNGTINQSYNFSITNNGTIHIIGTNVIPTGTTEIVDIPGIMFDVLTMPFTFISVAFNLTLFPGTPYQINISNLFLILIAVAVFAFLMSILLKAAMKSGG